MSPVHLTSVALAAPPADLAPGGSGGGLLANPVVASGFIGRDAFMKALAAQVVSISWGADKFVTTAEGTNFTIYDLASDKSTVTPVRKGFARQISDMMRSFDSMSALQWANFVREGTWAWQQTVVSVMAALFPSFSATGGNSGGNATWGAIVADYLAMGQANVPGPYVLVMRPKDWANVAQDAYSLGGRVAQSAQTDQFLQASNPGFKGVFMGGDLWIYTSDELSASGGDHISGMFGMGAIDWTARMPAPSPATRPLFWSPLWGVETDREALKSDDVIAYSTHLGASIGINAAGRQLPFVT